MNDAAHLVLAAVAGAALGAFFFAGLWWTIIRAVASKRPAAWFLGSLFLRTLVVLASFYLVARGDWRRLLACMLGFVAARMVVLRATRPRVEKAIWVMKERGL